MPTGWSYFIAPGTRGHNLSITNGQLQIGQVDTAGGIYRSFDTSGVTRVQIDYDAGIPNMVFGGGVASVLTSNILNYNFGPGRVQAGAGKTSGGGSMSSIVDYVSPGGVFQNAFTGALGNQSGSSNFHFSTTYQDGLVSQTLKNLVSGQTFSSGNVAISGFKLSDMSQLALFGVTTTGASGSFDNVRITQTWSTTPLPTPTDFTAQVLQFAKSNLSQFPVSDQLAVANSTAQIAPLIDSTSNKYLKLAAQIYAPLFKQTAADIGVITSTIDVVTGFIEGNVKAGVQNGLKALAKFVGTTLLDAVVDATENPSIDAANKAASFVDTLKRCADSTLVKPEFVAINAAACLTSITGQVFGGIVAPTLYRYGNDPFNPNYSTVAAVAIPTMNVSSLLYQPAIDALLRAGGFLAAVNETYDRYVTAYGVGDTASQLLQIQAYMNFLAEYNQAMNDAKNALSAVTGSFAGIPLFNGDLDVQSLLGQIQEELRTNGFQPSLLTDLTAMGLTADQIHGVEINLLALDFTRHDPSLANAFSTLSAGVDALSVDNTVPTAGTLPLILLAICLLVAFRFRNNQSATHNYRL